ncbi:MAG: hypothetical protein KGN36_17310 [Acidobacteriota bacterium]|nr:hypothetical protein [Acidobacteriota bacterium]
MSIRTAQGMEKSALPVYRGPGAKAPVHALTQEIDAWKARTVLAGQPAPEAPPTRREWMRYGWIAVPAALAAGGGIAAFERLRRSADALPGSWRIQGADLVVTGEGDSPLWSYRFPEVPESWLSCCAFADFTGQGRRDTLFIYRPNRQGSTACLCCFDRKGSHRWTLYPGKTVVDNLGRRFSPPYSVEQVVTFRPRGASIDRIASVSVHNYSFPAQLAILDGGTGKVIAEYWHRGHLNHLAAVDLDGDGEPELLAGGVNDAPEFKQATLLVFDHRRVGGATPNPNGGSYYQAIAPMAAKRTVFFPKSPLARHEEFNRVGEIKAQSDRIVVAVAEGTTELHAESIVYELDYNLTVVNVLLADASLNTLRELQRRGEIPTEPAEAIAERLKQGVRVL